MFGYIRPLNDELKIKDYNKFKSVYCALCRELGRKYGFLARNLLSYDMVFLAMLVDCTGDYETADFICPLHPFSKRKCRAATKSISYAADVTVILAWHKLNDSVNDERGLKKVAAVIARSIFKPAYKKACALMPRLAEAVGKSMERLCVLEQNGEPSIDKTADVFASMMAGLIEGNTAEDRIFADILYHIGRWTYIADACDDIAEDFKKKEYNPIAARYGITDGKLEKQQKNEIEFTLSNSLAAAAAAYELLDAKSDDEIIRNIIYFGLPAMMRQVIDGRRGMRKEKIK